MVDQGAEGAATTSDKSFSDERAEYSISSLLQLDTHWKGTQCKNCATVIGIEPPDESWHQEPHSFRGCLDHIRGYWQVTECWHGSAWHCYAYSWEEIHSGRTSLWFQTFFDEPLQNWSWIIELEARYCWSQATRHSAGVDLTWREV